MRKYWPILVVFVAAALTAQFTPPAPPTPAAAVNAMVCGTGSGIAACTNAATIPAETLLGTTATNSASLGSELTSSGGCSGVGWTGTYPTYVPPGTTAALTCTLTGGTVAGNSYQTLITITSYAAGDLNCTVGGAAIADFSGNNSTAYGPKATTTAALICTPSASFVTASVTVSVKLISPITVFSLTGKDSTGAVAFTALYQQTAGLHNIFVGGGGAYNTTGGSNVANGSYALQNNTTGGSNVANGFQALYNNTTGANNVANGLNALYTNTTGYSNVANGVSALQSNTTGFQNVANGVNALLSNTTGASNVANGVNALQSNTTGSNNTANGLNALVSNTTGYSNVANGVNALYFNTTGYQNVANGLSALYFNTTGYQNVANGVSALQNNTTGYQNVANGVNALYSNTTGYSNVANGVSALQNNTTGSNNVACGAQAGYTATPANANVSGSNNTWCGYNSGPNTATQLSNTFAYGNGALVGASNTGTLGNASVTDVYLGGPTGLANEHSAGYVGPASAPSGACPTNGVWVFSQDGHATVCLSSTWSTKI